MTDPAPQNPDAPLGGQPSTPSQATGLEASQSAPTTIWRLNERLTHYAGYGASHLTQFANRPVQDIRPGQSLTITPGMAYALRCDYDDDDMMDRIEALLATEGVQQIEALIFGVWGDSEGVCTGESSSAWLVQKLVDIAGDLPNLKALFIGDITSEECEISWLIQSDMSPILRAYSQLEVFQVRGGTGLEFAPREMAVSETSQTIPQVHASGPIAEGDRHEQLKALIVETGGLGQDTFQQICAWDFPALEHLEIWFGDENYGGNCWTRDLPPILEELRFPNLVYLGLRNSRFTHEMIDDLLRSPLLGRLQVLDISLGTLDDASATKLMDCPAIRDLGILNVAESYLSGAMIDELQTLGIQVVTHGQRTEEDYGEGDRYCAISE